MKKYSAEITINNGKFCVEGVDIPLAYEILNLRAELKKRERQIEELSKRLGISDCIEPGLCSGCPGCKGVIL